MATTSNRDYFFQTSAALDSQERKDAKSQNTNGNPIRLQSKILAVRADPVNQGSIYVAQSNGIVSRVILATGETSALFKGPVAPVTSVCLSPDGKLLFAGCWDKTVWSWDVASGQPRRKYEGHTDFVKSVISARLRGEDLLISGGADAQVLVFNIASGERIETFRDHTRGIQDLAFDPEAEESQPVVFSAGSDREIRQLNIFGNGGPTEPLLPHDTSVYKLFFDNDGDLWTASADKTAKCLVRADGWKANLSLKHPDFVRDIVVYESGGWVITACRDEEVRVWNRSTGELHHTFSGHFEEVTGLVLVGSTVASVGIDGTIRQWSLRPDELQKAVDLAKNGPAEEEKPKGETMLTEEEERELAELMDD
ncbi:hypothetical protein PENDEC_c025G06814 [Penicillium decumbens]|uniref:Uncharacterized protein n=1 Tax=Penicillium decumbens TaxID=69771 RepID=A0A1V6P018_PENDC|nr:hypothetical protein PENDEC_c025G06814 [Penicillium decumbens]